MTPLDILKQRMAKSVPYRHLKGSMLVGFCGEPPCAVIRKQFEGLAVDPLGSYPPEKAEAKPVCPEQPLQ